MTLLLLGPLIWVAAAIPWALLRGTLGRRHPPRAALTAGLGFTLWFTWFLITWLGMPDSYPAPSCPGNIPPGGRTSSRRDRAGRDFVDTP